MRLTGLFFFILFLPICISCNLYSSFVSPKTDAEYLEEAQQCLNNDDYACAIANYEKISDTLLRNRKLCLVHMTRAGLKVSALINIITESNSSALGNLAKQLIPWSQDKGDIANLAKTQCDTFKNTADSGNEGVLFRSLSRFLDCATRIARVEKQVAASESDNSCNTAGNDNGSLEASDVADSDGNISASNPGMCPSDVGICRTDILEIDPDSLSSAGLSEVKGAYDNLPDALKDSNAATSEVRKSLRETL